MQPRPPYEDFAETFAHFLHICDAIDTAHQYGLAAAPESSTPFRDVVKKIWLPSVAHFVFLAAKPKMG